MGGLAIRLSSANRLLCIRMSCLGILLSHHLPRGACVLGNRRSQEDEKTRDRLIPSLEPSPAQPQPSVRSKRLLSSTTFLDDLFPSVMARELTNGVWAIGWLLMGIRVGCSFLIYKEWAITRTVQPWRDGLMGYDISKARGTVPTPWRFHRERGSFRKSCFR